MRFRKRFLAAVLAVLLGTSVVSAVCGVERAAAKTANEYRDEELIHPDNKSLTGYDIVFVIDNSGSIWKQQEIRDAALRTVADLAVGSDVRIGAVYFADHVYSTFKLTSVEDETSYHDVITNGLQMTKKDESNRDTNIGAGLKAGLALFEDQDTSRERVMILLSDGINENLAQSASYKANANKETKEQVSIIQEKGYPLYCAFIEKSYGDKEYLRELVNYFGNTDAYDSRLVTVSDSDINMLADCMAGIFYDLNGGMKYKKLNLDSHGNDTFYIPDLNVTELQIYLNNFDGVTSVLTDPDGNTVSGWSEGNSSFYTVEDPSVGDWQLSVDSDTPVTGTIAYYTDICLRSEIIGDVARGQEVLLHTDFYDSEEIGISLDTSADLKADFSIRDVSSDSILAENNGIAFDITGKAASSDSFMIDAAGAIGCKIRITYDEFIDLTYTVQRDKEIHTFAPSAKDYNGAFLGLIPSFPEGDGMQASLKLKDYVEDPDGTVNDLTITDVKLNNTTHQAEVRIQDGKLNFITADGKLFPAFIEGTITFADKDNQTAEMNFKGYIINMTNVLMIAIVLAVLVFGGAYLAIRAKKKRNALLETFGGYMTSFDEQQAIAESLLKECNMLEEDSALSAYQDNCTALQELIRDENLTDEVMRILGISLPSDPAMVRKLYSSIDETTAQAKKVVDFAIAERQNFAEYKNMSAKSLEARMKHVRLSVQSLLRENDKTKEMLECTRTALEEGLPGGGDLKDNIEFLSFMKERHFENNIVLNIKRKQAVIMKNSRCMYRLMDDAAMLNLDEDETLGEYYGVKTGIVFMPYEQADQNGRKIKGVIAISDKQFAARDQSESEEQTIVDTSVIIPAGSVFRLELEEIGTVFVQIE